MKKKKSLGLIGLAMLIIAAVSGTYAYFSDKISVDNTLQLGDIRILLEDNGLPDSEKGGDTGKEAMVLPGDTVFRVSRITCQAEPCYIRALFTAKSPDDTTGRLPAPDIRQSSDDWIKIGRYYYYKNPLASGEHAELLSRTDIPAAWSNEQALKNLSVDLQVDAIQSKNFTPDFNTDTPWGEEEIEVCAHTGPRVNIVNPYNTMYVEFEENSHKLLAVPDDFFSNMGNAMPGDSFTDTVTLKNTTKKEAEFLFRTKTPESLNEEEKELLEQISLVITLGQKELYRGNLEAADLNTGISLGTYPGSTEEKFHFSLNIPHQLKNAYALSNTAVTWVFSVKENAEAEIIPAIPARTQDSTQLIFYCLSAFSAVLGVGVCLLYRKKYRKEEP